jgi:MFS family permease
MKKPRRVFLSGLFCGLLSWLAGMATTAFLHKELSGQPAPIQTRIWQIATVAGTSAFIAMLNSTIANLALEHIRTDLAMSLTTIQWAVTGYLIALAVSLPAAAWLGSRFGYGRVWWCSLAGFVGGSVLSSLAPEPDTLIGASSL